MQDAVSIPTPEFRVRLVLLFADLEPDDITSRIGIQPSRTWRSGELRHPKARLLHEQNGWVLSCMPVATSHSLDQHVMWLLDQIEPFVDRLGSLPGGVAKTVYCAINDEGRAAILQLSRGTVDRLARAGLAIEIDYYPGEQRGGLENGSGTE